MLIKTCAQQNYYNVYGVQQYSPYYPSVGGAGTMGLVQNMYPYYGQYAQNIHGPGFGVQYPQMTQIPVLSQNYGSSGILSFPSSTTLPTISPGNKSDKLSGRPLKVSGSNHARY